MGHFFLQKKKVKNLQKIILFLEILGFLAANHPDMKSKNHVFATAFC